MKYTLRMRAVGPQQAWGTRSRFDLRDTELAPTKSGVVGMVAAALGLTRNVNVTHLAGLRMGVRVDRPGARMTDYHTALDVVDTTGRVSKDAVVSVRSYLSDAAFLIGLEGADNELLKDIQGALVNPRWPLALGRRSFPPGLPVAFSGSDDPASLVEAQLEEALADCPSIVPRDESVPYRFLIEHPTGDQEWFDQPADNFVDRTFLPRRLRVVEAKRGETWF